MKDNDVVKELEKKNQELFVNKVIIDLENTMESLMMFYSKNNEIDDNGEKAQTYCDIVAQEVISRLSSFLDNPSDYTQQEKIAALVTSFFAMFKKTVNTIISERLQVIKTSIQTINAFNYEKKLNSESLVIVNKVSEFYQENVYMLIDEVKDSIKEHQLDFKDYLLNAIYLKLMNTLKDKLMYSIKLINNNYDENTTMIQSINAKTLK